MAIDSAMVSARCRRLPIRHDADVNAAGVDDRAAGGGVGKVDLFGCEGDAQNPKQIATGALRPQVVQGVIPGEVDIAQELDVPIESATASRDRETDTSVHSRSLPQSCGNTRRRARPTRGSHPRS
jgi:hypothetical protein